MIAASYVVTVRVPAGMSIEQCRLELRASIGFGAPQVFFMSKTEFPPPQEDPPGDAVE